MGCFFACFGASKDANRVKQPHKPHPRNQESTIQRKPISTPVLSYSYTLQDDSNKPLRPVSEPGNKREVNITITEEVTSESNVLLPREEADPICSKKKEREREGEDDLAIASKPGCSSGDFSVPSSFGSCPLSLRYRNCRDSDDDDEVLDNTDNYLATDENLKVGYVNTLTDDEFGMVESKRKISAMAVVSEELDSSMPVCGLPEKGPNPIGLKRNARSRTANICPVLNPVENLSQWNGVKLKKTLPPTPQKENMKLERESPTLCGPELAIQKLPFCSKSKIDQPKKLNREIAVDASLSNWLVSSETTPVSKTPRMSLDTFTPVERTSQELNSPRFHEDGAVVPMPVEELKQFLSFNSPRKTPDQRCDEMPICGAVGSNGSRGVSDRNQDSVSSFKGIPNTTSKYREDKTVKWHSTPFETRLERALNRGVSKA